MSCWVGVTDLFKNPDGLLRPSMECQVVTKLAACPIKCLANSTHLPAQGMFPQPIKQSIEGVVVIGQVALARAKPPES